MATTVRLIGGNRNARGAGEVEDRLIARDAGTLDDEAEATVSYGRGEIVRGDLLGVRNVCRAAIDRDEDLEVGVP
jgi:hypothetical protein